MRSYFTFDMHTLYHRCKPCQFIYVCETIRTRRCYALLFWPRALVNDSFFCIAFCNTWYELACGVIVSCVYISVFHSGPSRKATPSQGVCLLVFARSETSILSTCRQKYNVLSLQSSSISSTLRFWAASVKVSDKGRCSFSWRAAAVGAAEQLGIWLHRREFFSKLHGNV